ncbi:hypothetical protein DICVIV_06404 [Dictyocaulus viviparus]|uniref:RING-type domain-containing protein n=1 Tax=Dictyocaulus viviparus TaxID=29172 RepID=A0A0D8XUK8_DICVI|nr:hypothetical protein DICVIV_06404 [Dictyocaulus viviparus]
MKMSDFMHCNCCFRQPSAQAIPKYFLTSCYHIICQSCLQKESGRTTLCAVCNHEMRAIEINSAMDSQLQDLFKPPKKLIEEKMTSLKRKYDFQQMLVRSVLSHLKKQREKLDQLTKYCHQQARLTKERAKELDELKEWVTVAEIKMKENEQEKECLRKELDDIKKLSKRFGREASYESTIDKIFAEAENNCRNATTCPTELTFGNFETNDVRHSSSPSFLQTSSSMTVNSTLGSLVGNVASPHNTTNNSTVSEMTTPKMLGLPKKGLSNSGGMSCSTSSGLDYQNPYAEVFSRSSIHQKRNIRTSSYRAGTYPSAKQSQLRFHSKSPTTSDHEQGRATIHCYGLSMDICWKP